MATLMVPVMDLLWVHKWKLHLDSLIFLMKSNMMDSLMVIVTHHT